MSKKISSKHFCNQWSIDLADRNSPKWSKGIEIIKDRFETRFFNQIDYLIRHRAKKIRVNSGFLIMSVDCLIIETLNQYYLGLKKTTDRYYNDRGNRINPNRDCLCNWQAFRDFFRHSSYFPNFKDNDILVKTFFNEIRCGLLHQAESKTNSLINIRNSNMVDAVVLGDYSRGIVVNRNLFHFALKQEFDKYLLDLSNPDNKNILGDYLRDKCNEKMVALCN